MANYTAFNPKHLSKIGQSTADGVTYTRFVYGDNTVVMAKGDGNSDNSDPVDATDQREHSLDANADRSNAAYHDDYDDADLPPLLTIHFLGDVPLSYTAMREMAGFFGMGKDVDITRIGNVFCIEKAVFLELQEELGRVWECVARGSTTRSMNEQFIL